MKIVITASKSKPSTPLDVRFGRCKFFILFDSVTQEWEAYPNPAIDTNSGAGTQAAQFVASLGAEVVISGRFGPNAFSALEAAEIGVFEAAPGNVDVILEAYLGGKLSPVTIPTHRGQGKGKGRQRRENL